MLALAVLGCGGGHKPSSSSSTTTARSSAAAVSPCRPAAIAAVAHFVAVPASAVATRVTTDNSNQPECVFVVPRRKLRLSVSVSSEPQAYAVLERQAEETAQIFSGKRMTPAPQHITHLGIDAYWFPALDQVLTTDAVHLITATIVNWPHVPKQRWRGLGVAAARPDLGRFRLDLARGPAPCGNCAPPGPSSTTSSAG